LDAEKAGVDAERGAFAAIPELVRDNTVTFATQGSAEAYR
jgi:hypothetical protein